ncbi:MAG: YgiQ family radical SAM protein [Desulfomonilia bacterium]|jgi:uncharacterized radical SAM protein YgiQ
MFLPTTRTEMESLGWERCDVILVTGDSYIDHPSIGVSLISKVLMDAGFKPGIIAQPDVAGPADVTRLGEPALFWGVTGGCVDSMVANYTASGKRRKSDDYTPGGVNDRRPDRALIVYTNLIRRYFKNTRPVVLGGIEASTRRLTHYDHVSGRIRRSVLFDAKADILVYGMGERTVIELARRLSQGRDYRDVKGICFASGEKPRDCIELPSHEAIVRDRQALAGMFRVLAENSGDQGALRLCQLQDSRYLVHNPPQPPLSQHELDRVYSLDFERDHHPFYERMGSVRALDTMRFSLTTHRGCFGGCSFCSIGVHQGCTVVSRSQGSIVEEARHLTRHPAFKGIISDVGGPTANMYAMGCSRGRSQTNCGRRCLFPSVCPNLTVDHGPQIELLRAIRGLQGVKKAFVASGLRHDLVLADERNGEKYLRELVAHHVSGQLKIAPEHTARHVLELMGKPGPELLSAFRDLFARLVREDGRKQFLTYYFIAAHPGCTLEDMQSLKHFATKELGMSPEQVQIFTPLPSTLSSVMYCTGRDLSGREVFVEKDPAARQRQKDVLTEKPPARMRRRRR